MLKLVKSVGIILERVLCKVMRDKYVTAESDLSSVVGWRRQNLSQGP